MLYESDNLIYDRCLQEDLMWCEDYDPLNKTHLLVLNFYISPFCFVCCVEDTSNKWNNTRRFVYCYIRCAGKHTNVNLRNHIQVNFYAFCLMLSYLLCSTRMYRSYLRLGNRISILHSYNLHFFFFCCVMDNKLMW